MTRPIEEQIDTLLYGNVYSWAVSHGYIRQGELLRWEKVFTITQRDVLSYLKTHPVPGVDIKVTSYQSRLTDGPRWQLENGQYIIGWQERGIFSPEDVATTEGEFRSKWVTFLVRTLGLAA